MAGLADALEAEQNTHKGPRCAVALALEAMDDDDAAVLQAALDDKQGKQASVISRALKAVGHEVGGYSLARHRRGDCSCDRGQA